MSFHLLALRLFFSGWACFYFFVVSASASTPPAESGLVREGLARCRRRIRGFAPRVRFDSGIVEEAGEVAYAVGHCVGVSFGFVWGIGLFSNGICPSQSTHHVGNGGFIVHMVVWDFFPDGLEGGAETTSPFLSC